MVTIWLTAMSLAAALLAVRHPMHTSAAELREAGGVVEVSIRAFPDDLDTAVPGARGTGTDSALAEYVLRMFSIADQNGRLVPLRWLGAERDGDVLLLRLEGRPDGGLAGAAVAHRLLMERFDDQVNLVRAVYGGRMTTLLFLPGDSAKRLP
jgi:hypothetical protein